jgi:hypothetical protein
MHSGIVSPFGGQRGGVPSGLPVQWVEVCHGALDRFEVGVIVKSNLEDEPAGRRSKGPDKPVPWYRWKTVPPYGARGSRTL